MSLNFPVKIKKSKIAGTGAYSVNAIPGKRKIGNMTGEIISYKEVRRRIRKQKGGILYMVEFDNEDIAMDVSVRSNELRYINHSCNPNVYMRRAYRKVEYYALRNIKKGEELTCDYGETHHEGTLPCKCGAKNCRGFI
ncbi:MAG: SET domain-containing protein-lysine N-methyltransferase [Sphingobacteriales bacterium]|nr:SET domain-containing protein-lysine N-methyltransferase [Sphingobacteriales bacterium]